MEDGVVVAGLLARRRIVEGEAPGQSQAAVTQIGVAVVLTVAPAVVNQGWLKALKNSGRNARVRWVRGYVWDAAAKASHLALSFRPLGLPRVGAGAEDAGHRPDLEDRMYTVPEEEEETQWFSVAN